MSQSKYGARRARWKRIGATAFPNLLNSRSWSQLLSRTPAFSSRLPSKTFENFSVFKPAPQQEKSVNAMLDQVIAWSGALKTLREKQT